MSTEHDQNHEPVDEKKRSVKAVEPLFTSPINTDLRNRYSEASIERWSYCLPEMGSVCLVYQQGGRLITELVPVIAADDMERHEKIVLNELKEKCKGLCLEEPLGAAKFGWMHTQAGIVLGLLGKPKFGYSIYLLQKDPPKIKVIGRSTSQNMYDPEPPLVLNGSVRLDEEYELANYFFADKYEPDIHNTLIYLLRRCLPISLIERFIKEFLAQAYGSDASKVTVIREFPNQHYEAQWREICALPEPEQRNRKNAMLMQTLCLAVEGGDLKLFYKVINLAKKRGFSLPLNFSYGARGGKTPLMLAAENGRLEMVKALVTEGADINELNIGVETALMTAAKNGHVKVVQEIITAFPGLRADHPKFIALVKQYPKEQQVTALLEMRKDFPGEFLYPDLFTFAVHCLKKGRLDDLAIFKTHFPEVCIQTIGKDGNDLLIYAAEIIKDKFKKSVALAQKPENFDAMIALIRWLINNGSDTRLKNKQGKSYDIYLQSLWCRFLKKGNIAGAFAFIQSLPEVSFDLGDVLNYYISRSPDYRKQYDELLVVIKKFAVPEDVKEKPGEVKQHKPIGKELAQAAFLYFIESHDGATAEDSAALEAIYERMLVEFPDIQNVVDKDGNTALHKIALQGNLPLFQRLLKAGANPVANKAGHLPYQMAAQNKELFKAASEAGLLGLAAAATAGGHPPSPKAPTGAESFFDAGKNISSSTSSASSAASLPAKKKTETKESSTKINPGSGLGHTPGSDDS